MALWWADSHLVAGPRASTSCHTPRLGRIPRIILIPQTGWSNFFFIHFWRQQAPNVSASSFLTSAEIMVWQPLPLLLAFDWRCGLRQLMAVGAWCHAASGCKLFGAACWEGHNQLRVLVGRSVWTAPTQHNRASCPWSLLPFHTRAGSRLASVPGSQLSALTVKSRSLLKHREIPVCITAAQLPTILSVRHLCSWL